jgi:hypothetical protein
MSWTSGLAFVVFVGASLGCVLGIWLLTGRAALRERWSGGAGVLWVASVVLGCLLAVVVPVLVGFAAVNAWGFAMWLILLLGPALAMRLGPWGIMGLGLGMLVLALMPLGLGLRRLVRQGRWAVGLGLWIVSVILGILGLLPVFLSFVVGPEALVFRVAHLLRIS